MANFIDRLSEQVAKNKDDLRETLTQDARPQEQDLQRLVKKHWRKLPERTGIRRHPAYAVDGSRAVRHLANGAYLFVAQALIVGEQDGERKEDTQADVRILPGATPTPFVERFAELIMHRLEANLARQRVNQMAPNSVIFLDGALYSQLPQLFPIKVDGEEGDAENRTKELINEVAEDILESYRTLFAACRRNGLTLISIAKTSRDTIHTKVWWEDKFHEEMPRKREVSTTEALFRWTNLSTGYTTPILLGKRAFSKQPEFAVLSKVKDAPAILSFFIRPADFDDALRIDVPACCIGRAETIGEIESGEEILLDQPADLEGVKRILELLMADYGGFEVYNALMYSADREVRLRQDMMDQVYLSLIQNTLGSDVELRLDRSERRFHSR